MNHPVAAESYAPAAARQIRIMVVDDAVVARGMMRRWIEAEPDMKIVAALAGAREALDAVAAADPDVVLLDIDMPGLDGISALPLLLRKKPGLVVIMVSTLTRRNAELTLRALSLGAADCIPKPETAGAAMTSATFRRELINKIRGLGQTGVNARRAVGPRPLLAAKGGFERTAAPPPRRPDRSDIALRPFSPAVPRAILVGASTGGPPALSTMLEKLTAAIDRAPVLIAQHMPTMFTTVLAEHLTRVSGRGAHEAEDGEPVLAGGIYLAPGGRHMRVVGERGAVKIALGDDPPINFCRPAIDPLFDSAAAVWGASALAIVLTGMGTDGTGGAAAVVAAGGSVIAQDEATSVVWGMPRSVAEAGLCAAVLPLGQIAGRVLYLLSGCRS